MPWDTCLPVGEAPDPASLGAHNWFGLKALEALRARCPSVVPAKLVEQSLHYGIHYADNPWLGRPESPGTPSPSVREDLYGKHVDASGDPDTGFAAVMWSNSDADHPNLYLKAVLTFALVLPFDKENFPISGICHFLNQRALVVDGTEGCEGSLAWGPKTGPASGHWNVSNIEYCMELFKLARAFYPGSRSKPRLDGLLRRPTGRLMNHVMFAKAEVPVPDLYLGSNEFIETPDGKPTWPIWVPDTFDLGMLTQNEPPQSANAASIYLGWAMHMAQDIMVPYHAANTHGARHQAYERLCGEIVRERIWLDHLPLLATPAGGPAPAHRYGLNEPVFRPNIAEELASPEFRRRLASSRTLRRTLAAMAQTSARHYKEVQSIVTAMVPSPPVVGSSPPVPLPDAVKRSKLLPYVEQLADVAIKGSMMLIACLVDDVAEVDVVSWLAPLLLDA